MAVEAPAPGGAAVAREAVLALLRAVALAHRVDPPTATHRPSGEGEGGGRGWLRSLEVGSILYDPVVKAGSAGDNGRGGLLGGADIGRLICGTTSCGAAAPPSSRSSLRSLCLDLSALGGPLARSEAAPAPATDCSDGLDSPISISGLACLMRGAGGVDSLRAAWAGLTELVVDGVGAPPAMESESKHMAGVGVDAWLQDECVALQDLLRAASPSVAAGESKILGAVSGGGGVRHLPRLRGLVLSGCLRETVVPASDSEFDSE